VLFGLFVIVAVNVERAPAAMHDGASRPTVYLRTVNVADALPTAASVATMTRRETVSASARRVSRSDVRDIVRGLLSGERAGRSSTQRHSNVQRSP
jgi:hypothetical protein